MKKVENDIPYMSGRKAAEDSIKFIANTTYGSLKMAVETKLKIVNHFEEFLKCNREIEDTELFERDYSYSCGMYDKFKEEYDKERS